MHNVHPDCGPPDLRQESTEEIYLIEIFLNTTDRQLGCTFKADNPARCQSKFLDYFKGAIRPLCRR